MAASKGFVVSNIVFGAYKSCVSYTGAGSRCRAGFNVEDRRDSESRLPCVSIRGITGKIPCVECAIQPDPPEPPGGRMATKLDDILEGNCPECHEAIEDEHAMGGVVTARPCGHVLIDRRKR